MVASAWNVGRKPSEWKREHLIEQTARIKARTPSQRPVRDLDLQIGATIVRQIKTGRGWLFECPRGCGRHGLHVYCPLDGVVSVTAARPRLARHTLSQADDLRRKGAPLGQRG